MDDHLIDKAELLRRLDQSFQRFDMLLSRAMEHDVEQTGVCGKWSVKDIVAHLIAHEQRTLSELNAARQGRRLDIKHEENDSFNAGAVYACQAMPFDLVHHQWRRSYRQVMEAVQALAEGDFDPEGDFVRSLDDTIDGALANNTYEHYDAHGAQIEAWLSQQNRS